MQILSTFLGSGGAPERATGELCLADVRRTHAMISPYLRRTPLVRAIDDDATDVEVSLKCENLQRTGSFKLRAAVAALLHYQRSRPAVWRRICRHGIATCSSGNLAQALAHVTARLGLGCTVVVPDAIAPVKLRLIARHNPQARIVRVDYDAWRQAMSTGGHPDVDGFFLAPESDEFVALGNATIALEIVEDLPQVDCVLVPFGGGHLAYSLATLLRQIRPEVEVHAVEISTGAPLSASLRAGRPVEVEYTRSFVDGIGASFLIPHQFERLRRVLAGALTVTPAEVAGAVSRLMLSSGLVAEGAGAAAFAAARRHAAAHRWRHVCCVITGGVIAPDLLGTLLRDAEAPAHHHA